MPGYVLRRALNIDGVVRGSGLPVPEAASWKNLRAYIGMGWVAEVSDEDYAKAVALAEGAHEEVAVSELLVEPSPVTSKPDTAPSEETPVEEQPPAVSEVQALPEAPIGGMQEEPPSEPSVPKAPVKKKVAPKPPAKTPTKATVKTAPVRKTPVEKKPVRKKQ